MKRSEVYKAANVTFNPKTLDAYSYNWWRFVGVVEGKTIFNTYRYSVTTAKHQHKVRELMIELGIRIDIFMPLPRGIRHDQTLEEMIVEAEETLCDEIIKFEEKKISRAEKAQLRKASGVLTNYLENNCAFRDYEIKPRRLFGKLNTVAVHQVVDMHTMEQDVENAINNFHRDGFGKVVFYVGAE